jgi:hypothetical protein
LFLNKFIVINHFSLLLKSNTVCENSLNQKEYAINHLHYIIRSANEEDAQCLFEVRVQIDGETENMDREAGEAYIDEAGFKKIIHDDTESDRSLFLVAEVNGRIAGFSRCEGSKLNRSAHKVELGVCVLKEYWGYGMGKNSLVGRFNGQT